MKKDIKINKKIESIRYHLLSGNYEIVRYELIKLLKELPTTPQPQLPEEIEIDYSDVLVNPDESIRDTQRTVNALIRYLKSLPVSTTKE